MKAAGERWGIVVTLPTPHEGPRKEKLLTDKEGVVILMSKKMAVDYMRTHQERLRNARPEPRRVRVTAEVL